MSAIFSPIKIKQTSERIQFYRSEWDAEVPLRIHARGVDEGHGLGGPPLHPDFEKWLGPICFCGRKADPKTGEEGCPSEVVSKNTRRFRSGRNRTTKAFRRLRKIAPREFDALYLMVAHKASFDTTLKALNERAERLNKPERYTPQDVIMLIVLGIDKIDLTW